jgi:hypothetical protein
MGWTKTKNLPDLPGGLGCWAAQTRALLDLSIATGIEALLVHDLVPNGLPASSRDLLSIRYTILWGQSTW